MRILMILIMLCALASNLAMAYEWEYVGMDGIGTTCLELDSHHDRLFVGTHEGFWTYDLTTGVWAEFDDEGWIGRQVHAVQGHPTDPDRILTGRQNAFFKGYVELSTDGGATGDPVHMSEGGAFWALDHDGQYFYAGNISDITPGELLRSATGDAPWMPLFGHGHTAITALGVGHMGDLLAAGDNQVAISYDAGETWEDVGADLGDGLIRCLATFTPSGDVIFTGALAGGENGLWQGFTPFDSWEQILAGESCRAATMMSGPAPWPLSRINRPALVTTDGRVLVADRYLAAWQDETGELPGQARDLQFVWQDEYLYVCTASAGVFRFRPVISAAGDVPVAAGPRLESWPNPFNPRANLRSELPRTAVGRLAIYDLAGRLVTVLEEGSFPAGMHTSTWDAVGQASGVYLARLETDLGTVATRLVLVR